MELRRYLAVFRRHLVLIVVSVVVALGVAWATTPHVRAYQAQATLYIGPGQVLLGSTQGVQLNPVELAGELSVTFSKMIQSRVIADDAVAQAAVARSPDLVAAETTATPEPNTQLIRIGVTDRDPNVAETLANAMADAFVNKVRTFNPSSLQQDQGVIPAFPVYVFERARVPLAPMPSPLKKRLALAGVFGLVVAAGAAFTLEYLDLTLHGVLDAQRRLELPVLGAIPVGRGDV